MTNRWIRSPGEDSEADMKRLHTGIATLKAAVTDGFPNMQAILPHNAPNAKAQILPRNNRWAPAWTVISRDFRSILNESPFFFLMEKTNPDWTVSVCFMNRRKSTHFLSRNQKSTHFWKSTQMSKRQEYKMASWHQRLWKQDAFSDENPKCRLLIYWPFLWKTASLTAWRCRMKRSFSCCRRSFFSFFSGSCMKTVWLSE